jgi:hypothetical protein
MIDVLDGGMIARRIGGHVVLQGNGDVDQLARRWRFLCFGVLRFVILAASVAGTAAGRVHYLR